MNIQFNYLYRDASNYKQYGNVIFSNLANIELEIIKNVVTRNLIDGEFFIADEWGLPPLFFEDKNEDDQQWHEFESLVFTNSVECSADIDELLKKILKVYA